MKRLLPDVIAIAAFVILSFVYFFPADTEGRILFQHDTEAGVGAGQEAKQYYERTGERTRWTNSIFGGMPTYQISPSYDSTKPLSWAQRVYRLFLPNYVYLTFIMMLGFYILLRAFGIPAWYAGIGGVLWAFSSYFFILISAGHIWKFITLAYIPPTIAGMVLAYRGKLLAGGVVTSLFLAMQIVSNHVQMSYYFLFVMLFIAIAYLADAWRKRTLPQYFKATAVLAVAACVGVAVNLSNLYHTYTYSKETMRGKSELTYTGDAAKQTSSGLDRDYITQWSYGIGETLTLLMPNFKGGSSAASLSQSEVAMAKGNPMYGNLFGLSQYFGDQPWTAGPVYVGAFVLFLFLVGCFVVKGPLKWALLGVTVLSVLLSWGKNFMPLTDFFIDYVPMYNKFRAVSSILVVAEFTIPLLAVLALVELVRKPGLLLEKAQGMVGRWPAAILGGCCGLLLCLALDAGGAGGFLRFFYLLLSFVAGGAYFVLMHYVATRWKGGMAGVALLNTAGIALLVMLWPGALSSSYIPQQEMQMLEQYLPAEDLSPAITCLEDMRRALVTMDARRSLLVILAGFALLWLYAKGKLHKVFALGGVALLCLVDMWSVNKRYLNDSQFVQPSVQTTTFTKTSADELILQDQSLDYRVLDFARNTFNDNTAAYWHKSVGGYHAAKLRRYQELIDHHIMPEMQAVYGEVAAAGGQMDSVDASKFPVLNMLNTKYFLFATDRQGGMVPVQNPYALGNAWFVDELHYVDNANEEIEQLGQADPRHVAVADRRFSQTLGEAGPASDDNQPYIRLKEYEPNRLVYETDNEDDGIAVFSEIYYPDGWYATIDGQPAGLARVNYVLRAMRIPAGQHVVEMRFDPRSLHVTEGIAYAGLGLLGAGLLALLLSALAGKGRKSLQA